MRLSERELDRLQRLANAVGEDKRPSTSGSPVMNGLETDYAQTLDVRQAMGDIADWQFGSVRLHLGGGAYYKPDFVVWLPGGGVEIHETKGHWREAARVRIKVAASRFPLWLFLAVTRKKGEWQSEEIRP